MKKIIPILILFAVGVAGYLYFGPKKEDPNRIRISGNLEVTQIDIAFKIAGKISELLVREGDAVTKGSIIARLDKETISLLKVRDEAGIASAQSGIAQMDTAILWQRDVLARETELRRYEIRAAEATLNNLLAGSREQEISQANAALDDAKAQLQQATGDWDRAQKLFQKEDISKAQFDQFQTRFRTTTAAVKSAEQRVSLVQEGPRKQDVELARAQLERAKAALKLTEANAKELTRKEQEMGTRRAEMSRAKAQVAVTDSQMNDTTAASPLDGVVLVKAAELGEVVAPGATVVTIADIEHPWVRGYIPETQLARVKLGQKVKLTTDSYKDKEYWGTITYISSQAEFTPKQIQTTEERVKYVYRVKISVDNPKRELKLNMPVDGEIVLGGE